MASEFKLLCNGSTSSVNGTSELWLVKEEDKVTGQVTAAFLLLILVVGLPWNLLVVLTIVKEKLYHQPTIVVLLFLALNDIFLLVTEFPVRIVTGIAGEFVHGNTDSKRCIVCTIGSFSIAFAVLSLYIITTLAFDRFLFIYKPLHYDKIMTSFRMAVGVVIMLIVLLLVLGVPPWFFSALLFNPAFLACVLDYTDRTSYYLVLVMIVTVIPVVLLVVFNVWVVVIVQKNIRAIYGIRQTLGSDKERDSHQNELVKFMKKKKHQKQLHLFNVFGALLGSCLVTWLPLIIIMIYVLINEAEDIQVSPELIATFNTIFISQVTVYPIVETIVIKDVREPMKKLFLCCCCKIRKKSESSDGSESSRLKCCGEFRSILHAAVLEHSRHSHSSYEEKPGKTQELALTEEAMSISKE